MFDTDDRRCANRKNNISMVQINVNVKRFFLFFLLLLLEEEEEKKEETRTCRKRKHILMEIVFDVDQKENTIRCMYIHFSTSKDEFILRLLVEVKRKRIAHDALRCRASMGDSFHFFSVSPTHICTD